MKPPDIIVLTPNGRFEVGKKICLSISGHHPETWQPSWSIRTALLAIIGFMPSPAQGTIGSLDYTPDERQALARRSQSWSCPTCGLTSGLLAPPMEQENPEQEKEVKDIVEGLQMKGEEKEGNSAAAVSSPNPTVEELPAPSSADIALPGSAGSNDLVSTNTTTIAASASASAPASAPASVPASAPASAQATNTLPAASVARPRRGRTAPVRTNQESVGIQQVYDFCIMLVVAAIAALLFRRFNVMQAGDNDASLGD